jgi:hypothetical protein
MVRPSRPKPANLQLAEEARLLRACGLCGESTRQLTRTECCDNLVCDDEDEYVVFSYARNSCFRNHDRQTLCAFHHREEHNGEWKKCSKCRAEFEPEMYAWYATNPFNFEKLRDPPPFAPTLCDGCGERIVLPRGGYTLADGKRWCERCDPAFPSKRRSRSRRRGI